MPPFYQPIIDLIATHPFADSLKLMLVFCRAAEGDSAGEIVFAANAMMADVNPEMAPQVLVPEEVIYEAMARMLFLGMDADLELLLDWYRPVSLARTRQERTAQHWEGIFEFIGLPPPNLSDADRDRQFKRMLTALRIVVIAHAGAKRAEPTVTQSLVYSGGSEIFLSAPRRPSVSSVLAMGIERLVTVWMILHQQWLDAALELMAANGPDRGHGLLALRDKWMMGLSKTFQLKQFENSAPFASVPIPLTHIEYGKSPHHKYLDAFPSHTDREFAFSPYDREPEDEPEGKRILLGELMRHRHVQLNYLLHLYGEHFPPDPPPSTPAAIHEEKHRKQALAERRKLIDQIARKGASLNIRTEDDLVKFGCALFQALMNPTAANAKPMDRAVAWDAVLDLLERHLTLFTSHSEFNLDEKTYYFDRLFPRAITGGEIHDCGVYAVRLAYVLLSVADCIKSAEYPKPPRASFIMFPIHVGVIVEIDGFAPIVVHNNLIISLAGDKMQKARDEWPKSPEKTDPTDPTLLEQRLLEDVAAQFFIRDLDMPILRSPIAHVSAPPKKTEIWKAFQRLVVRQIDQLFSPKVNDSGRAEYQFDLRFLFALDLEKGWHDRTVVPFWNTDCFGLWNERDPSGNRRFTTSILKNNARKRQEYAKSLESKLKPVRESYGTFEWNGKPVSDTNAPPNGLCSPGVAMTGNVLSQKGEITKEFRANERNLRGTLAQRITNACRLANFASSLGAVGQVQEHLEMAKDTTRPFEEPPFADEANHLSRH